MSAAAVIFWGSLLALGYVFAGYPLLVWLLSRLAPARPRDGRRPETVSVLIAAGNEAARLPAKIDSLLACEESGRITEVVVGSDGSTDGTAAVVGAHPDPRVRCIAFGESRGKSAVLADLIPTLTGEAVILTDARQHVGPEAVTALLDRLADPGVGVVSGELVFVDESGSAAAEGVSAYWRYEKFLRKCEANFRGVPGATGALYAVRRDVLRPPPADALLDDVAIPLLAVEQGVRCVFEPRAVAYDRPTRSAGQESVRKRRTIAGVVQLLMQHPRWLLPRLLSRRGCRIWWELMSHKVARLLAPAMLVACAASNAALVSRHGWASFYGLSMAGHIAFYALAAAGAAGLRPRGAAGKLLSVPMMFVSLNATTVLALWDAARGRYRAAWKRV